MSGPRETEINLSDLCQASDRWSRRGGGAVTASNGFTSETTAAVQRPHAGKTSAKQSANHFYLPDGPLVAGEVTNIFY